MVHLSVCNFVRHPPFNSFLKKQRILRLSAHYSGRRRNCYSIAIRHVHKALTYASDARKLKSMRTRNMWQTRIDASCEELGTTYRVLTQNLLKCNIQLNLKVLADLAIWEPRTFKSLTEIAQAKQKLEASEEVERYLPTPKGVITRGML